MDTEKEDHQIRTGLAAGDSAALTLIWEHYARDLLGYLSALLCSHHEAEDVMQELFILLSKKRERVAKARNLKPYLFRMARNTAWNHIKRQRRTRERQRESADWLESVAGETASGEDRAPGLALALATLPEKQRTVLVLKFYRNITFREIGERLGISENTASSRYRYGIDKLRQILQEASL